MANNKAPFVLLSGMLFGAGLNVSTMIRPEVILGFLRFHDMGLMLVLGGAVVVTLLTYRMAPKLMKRPLAGETFAVHPSSLNKSTIGGAAVFGIGWGACGVCPGPAIAGLGAGNYRMLLVLLGMFAGAYLQGRFFGAADRVSASPAT